MGRSVAAYKNLATAAISWALVASLMPWRTASAASSGQKHVNLRRPAVQSMHHFCQGHDDGKLESPIQNGPAGLTYSELNAICSLQRPLCCPVMPLSRFASATVVPSPFQHFNQLVPAVRKLKTRFQTTPVVNPNSCRSDSSFAVGHLESIERGLSPLSGC